MKLYIRHRPECKHRTNRYYNNCGCPIWFQHKRKRWAAGSDDWGAVRKWGGGGETGKAAKGGKGKLTIVEAVNLYLIRQSKKANHADSAPYSDRWLLRDGSKRQPSLLQWAEKNEFTKLPDITSLDVERWRNTWVFREESYSLKINHARIKAFFTWCVKFDMLAKNPFDKLDRLTLKQVPTLPLSQDEFAKLLHAAETSRKRAESTACLTLLMRYSGLANLDACSLKRTALTAEDTIRAYRKKTNKEQAGVDGWVYVKIPHEVAERLRAHYSIHPDYFFYNGKSTLKGHAASRGNDLRDAYNRAGIKLRGAHRLRDTFAVEYLNAWARIQDLSVLLGHSTISTTEKHYMPWDKHRQKQLNDAMDANLAMQRTNGGLVAGSAATIQ
jgi:integrase/recombinase XerD